ncbi:MAG: cellulase family glycosylhydrolase [Anaerolineales bacterium]|jgi:hypothetical protein
MWITGLMALWIVGCSLLDIAREAPSEWKETPPSLVITARASGAEVEGEVWNLWTTGTQLRGVNIYQRHVYPELDGPEFMGPGPLGPPYTQADLDQLSTLGANYVNISHPGLFDEQFPYQVNVDSVANLDRLLHMIERADMFAVISFRTGPGRSEFTFMLEEVGTWFDRSYLDDSVWTDEAAQEAWISMWRYTAERYRQHPIVVGYDLMVEPNANEAVVDIWDAEAFYDSYGNTLLDWNQLHPRITDAIRQVDPTTPILIGGMAYSSIDWLPYLTANDDAYTVYTFHQYAPHVYTHQTRSAQMLTYPGWFDTDWDGVEDRFDHAWLEDLLGIADAYQQDHDAPLAVNEFGVVRWVPGAANFLQSQIELFEQRGINYAVWAWEVSWEPYAQEVHAFNFRFGTDPEHRADALSNDLINVLRTFWELNTIRPSNFD